MELPAGVVERLLALGSERCVTRPRTAASAAAACYTCTAMQTYLVRTFGCQMNKHDSERVAGLLRARAWLPSTIRKTRTSSCS